MTNMQDLRNYERQKHNLWLYIKDRVDNRKDDYPNEYSDGLDFTLDVDYKIFISRVFYSEKRIEDGMSQKRIMQEFRDWIQGLCFISPLLEDLTQFTSAKDTELQEIDVLRKLIQIIWG